MEKKMELEEQKEQSSKEESKDDPTKYLMGCSRDHSKEIDIYSKTYKEKIDRV